MNILNFFKGMRKEEKSENEIFYINGAQTLPPPLEEDEEAECISRLGEDIDARNELIEHNLRLVVYIAKKFEGCNTGIEDLISIGTIGLVKAVSTFKPEKNIKLATYASRCIENEILMYIRKVGTRCEVSLDEPLNTDWDGNELLLSDVLGNAEDDMMYEIEKREERESIRRAVRDLQPRERKIIELRYGFSGNREYTQNEVADILGISQSYISRLEKRIIDKLRRQIVDSL